MSRVSADSLQSTYNRSNLLDILKAICGQLNGLSTGRMVNRYGALSAAPTTGRYAQGDFVDNATIAEVGTAGSKYIVTGWYCTVAGEPGTFKEARVLTGG